MNSVEKVVAALGGKGRGAKAKAALALGITPQRLNNWLLAKKIPAIHHEMVIQKAAEHGKHLKVTMKPCI